MKITYKYMLSFLLLLLFSLKIAIPVFGSYSFVDKADLEQQENSSEEKATKKSATSKFDLTDTILVEPADLVLSSMGQLALMTYHIFLSLQYFVIPTPPPW